MTEEGIFEMLSFEKLKKVKSVAKPCNIATEVSKLDILLKIKEVINKNDAKFKKAFSKLWGHWGGCLSFPCPHDIVYYLKFLLRAESCSDFVAICKSRNGESWNGMTEMMGTQEIKVGVRGIKVRMREMRGIRMGKQGIRVGMRRIRVILCENLRVYCFG